MLMDLLINKWELAFGKERSNAKCILGLFLLYKTQLSTPEINTKMTLIFKGFQSKPELKQILENFAN